MGAREAREWRVQCSRLPASGGCAMRTVVGLFENANEARLTIAELTEFGLLPQDISVLTNATAQSAIEASGRARLRTMELGDVGKVVASGPLSTELEQPGGPRELSDALQRFGFSPELARHYVNGIERGATLETVTVKETDADRVAAIMNKHAGRTMRDTAQGKAATAPEMGGGVAAGGVATRTVGRAVESKVESERKAERIPESDGRAFMEEERTIPIYKEELLVGKREIEQGAVRVTTHVTEKPYAEQVVLREEHVDIERRPANRISEESDFRESQIEMTERAEQAVGAKQTRLVEEVIIHKHVTNRTETIGDTLRSTEIDVRKFDASKYRDYFDQQRLGRSTFDEHVPALRFGEDLRREGRAGARWEEIETDVRARWEAKRPGTFDRFKESIRHAWSRKE
jgi:uncharacterized protein (TIGR02271 family)